MEIKNFDRIMNEYVRASCCKKDRDLNKLKKSGDIVRTKASAKLRYAVCICSLSLVFFVTFLLCIYKNTANDVYLSEMNSVVVAEFAADISNDYFSGNIISSTMGDCLKLNEDSVMDLLESVMLPRANASEIIISKMTENDERDKTVGVYARLKPLDTDISNIAAYYFSDEYDVKELSIYKKLDGSLVFNEYDISYKILNNGNEQTCLIYFENGEVFCCLEVISKNNIDIFELLKKTF